VRCRLRSRPRFPVAPPVYNDNAILWLYTACRFEAGPVRLPLSSERAGRGKPDRFPPAQLHRTPASAHRGGSVTIIPLTPRVTLPETGRTTWPLTTCPRAQRHTLRASNDERHQNRPYSDQTKRHPGSSDISTHRPSPSLRRMAIAPASRCDLMIRQTRLRCRCVRVNKKKASGVPRLS
jgi:hypothetical protein